MEDRRALHLNSVLGLPLLRGRDRVVLGGQVVLVVLGGQVAPVVLAVLVASVEAPASSTRRRCSSG